MGVFSLTTDVPWPNLHFFAGLKFNDPVSMHAHANPSEFAKEHIVWVANITHSLTEVQ